MSLTYRDQAERGPGRTEWRKARSTRRRSWWNSVQRFETGGLLPARGVHFLSGLAPYPRTLRWPMCGRGSGGSVLPAAGVPSSIDPWPQKGRGGNPEGDPEPTASSPAGGYSASAVTSSIPRRPRSGRSKDGSRASVSVSASGRTPCQSEIVCQAAARERSRSSPKGSPPRITP